MTVETLMATSELTVDEVEAGVAFVLDQAAIGRSRADIDSDLREHLQGKNTAKVWDEIAKIDPDFGSIAKQTSIVLNGGKLNG